MSSLCSAMIETVIAQQATPLGSGGNKRARTFSSLDYDAM